MNNNLTGEQIAKFRKAAGLTQEELGRAAGVSTQAVSRWECGGAPDLSLLPAIADKLGVTIDALFGREGGVPLDAAVLLNRFAASQPEGKQLDALCRMIYQSIQFMMPVGLWHEHIAYPEECQVKTDGEYSLMRCGVKLEEGLAFGVGSEEFAFMNIFPEPQKGWAAYFADYDRCRKMFAVLAQEGCLELLEMLYSEDEHYLVPEVAAARLGKPKEEIASLFAALYEVHLLLRLEMELESGKIYAYIINDNHAYVPFMLLTRCFMERHAAFYLQWISRKGPLLRKPRDGKKEDLRHEKT